MADKQAVLGNGAKFTGKISNSKSIEINGSVQADLVTEKVTIGSTGNFKGAVKSDLVVIAGEYEGKMKADSIWLTESSRISGEIHYKSLQMDRGAALNSPLNLPAITTAEPEESNVPSIINSSDIYVVSLIFHLF